MTGRPAQIFAHRGGRRWGPENTMHVFRRCLELGVDGIELDVQRCATGELVVFHDSDLLRTTNGAGNLVDCTFEELQRLSAGAWYDEGFAGERVPLLADVLALVDGKLTINIEVKNLPFRFAGIEDELVEMLSDYPAREKIVFSSFDHELIAGMSKKYPDWTYAALMVAIPENLGEYAASLKAAYWNPDHEFLDEKSVADARSGGLKILPWTVNDARSWLRLINLGVDGIITDDPEGLHAFLEEG